jgi:hypothetical protein
MTVCQWFVNCCNQFYKGPINSIIKSKTRLTSHANPGCTHLHTYGSRDSSVSIGVQGSAFVDPHILDFGISSRWVVSFMPRPLYPRENRSLYHWIRGGVGPRTGLDDVKNREFLPLPGLELRLLCRSARSQSLHRLQYVICILLSLSVACH